MIDKVRSYSALNLEAVMSELSRCRGMESLCRQRATFYPEESWKWLAEAEMWNHKAFERSIRHEESKAATSGIPSAGGDDFLRKIVMVPPKDKGNKVARREKCRLRQP